ncbi:ABC transporter ATP-binding protein [Bacillus marasmi]|uniref:ABC transporter ATP-binding protein n=1 Tax=Bacillus marasmi TaxID=1926279 RepID=UPI0011CAD2BC|nr:ABC transporter ATP-binding protein [Bacillus marasmi]
MLKGIINKLFKPTPSNNKQISPEEIEALVDAKIKQHSATNPSPLKQNTQVPPTSQDDYTLTPKQVDYALSIIEKIKNEFELTIDPAALTIKDLNRLIAYQRYKNKGTLVNLVKKGVLKRR